MIKRLEHMKETLMNCVQGQLGDLSSADAEELGAAIDMIKDLSEAVYYCTIVESMGENKEKEKEKPSMMMYPAPMDYNRYFSEYANQGGRNYRDMDYNMGRMYYEGSTSYAQDGNRQSAGESRNYSGREYPIELRDYREGRSPMSRKNYMERKMHGGGKEAQMQELEKYMQELGNDLAEMIQGSSPEEKQMLQKKLSALATKIV